MLNAVDTIRRDETKFFCKERERWKERKKGRNIRTFRKTEMYIILLYLQKKSIIYFACSFAPV